VVEIGNSRALKVGEWVLAIGSPFGFDHSVTAGIVSAKGRNLPSENYVPFIQTDVAINPGNSGGPLFNLDGKVVGINSQIYSRTGGFMGLSFAIPIDVAMDVVAQLKAQGYVSRGWLGVLIQDVTRELAESFGMEQPTGALVAQVLANSPAQQAGIQVGDVITHFAGREVENSSDLPPMVGGTKVGSKVDVTVVRGGKPATLTVTIAELPEKDEMARAGAGPSVVSEQRLGVTVADLKDEQRKELKVDQGGVLVQSVNPGVARSAGLQNGDVILRVNNTKVENSTQFQELVKALPSGKSAALLIQREGGPIFLALKLPEK
jgi:serine protease Do